ncbi:hypothetical protein [Corynebacterium variabile]|uniref:hypothetical protein n=1 Tax=Corynebacterium variabile TaxID=1727 RepID=UPI002649A3B7|nr:hypothetical protein [Corynebacterium variabile]MDN6479126.1 hypothetical protein [Corynebacterium variabile]
MRTTVDPPDETPRPPIGLLLRRLDRLINQRFETTLGTRGVTRRQWQLLNVLAKRPAGLGEMNAAVAPFLDQAAGETVERHLAPLVESGAVTVNDDTYELSDSGRELFASLSEQVRATRELTVRGLADWEYDRTISTLQTMIGNLEGGQ